LLSDDDLVVIVVIIVVVAFILFVRLGFAYLRYSPRSGM